ncbi:MAG: molybdenum cofactor guanylyltransferase [Kofleriaceae bacterium]
MRSNRCSSRDLTALILAGGRATRLGGIDKRTIVIDGATIFDRQCAVLLPRVAEIIISTSRATSGYRTVQDATSGLGPLAGVAAGLAAATTPWLLVVAGDMPFITGALIDRMVERARPDIDAVGIRIGDAPEPLVSVLHVSTCLAVVERRIAAGQLKASALLTDAALRVSWLDETDVRAIDPELRVLRNVNTPDDVHS